MSIIDKIKNLRKSEVSEIAEEVEEKPVKVQVVAVEEPKKTHREETKEWLNGGKKPQHVEKMEKNMGGVLKDKIKVAGSSVSSAVKTFSKGYKAGAGIKQKPKRPVIEEIGFIVGKQISQKPSQHQNQKRKGFDLNFDFTSNFDNAFSGFDLDFENKKKRRW